jgi:hypothetical protein
MTTPAHTPARHRPVNAPPSSRVRARARLDRVGSCRAPRPDPASYAVTVRGRGLNERVRARVLCSACPVQRLCRRTVLAVLTQPPTRPGETVATQGVWGRLTHWEVGRTGPLLPHTPRRPRTALRHPARNTTRPDHVVAA